MSGSGVAGAPWAGGPDGMFPPDPELEPLHERQYQVRAWRVERSTMLLRGAVMDLKHGSDLTERVAALGGRDDGSPLVMHHMVVDVSVSFPELVITGASVVFEVHPQPECPLIADNYHGLVGLPIARGFTHKVRELFGGPRGCTHTTALLQAMAPVALQCVFPMGGGFRGPSGAGAGGEGADSGPGRPGVSTFMRDTCHAWAADGELWQSVEAGRMPPVPLPIQHRMARAGVDPGPGGRPPA